MTLPDPNCLSLKKCTQLICWPYKYYHNYYFRYDPVPDIHRRKKSRSIRCIRTTQEIRINHGHIKEGIHVRGKRRPPNLPIEYDDYFISYIRKWGKCSDWKRTKKKKQWM